MAIRNWVLAALIFGLMAMAIASNTIACSVAPFSETWINQGTATWVGADADCRLESAVSSSAQAGTAAAIVHYRRAPEAGTMRLSFRIHAPPVSGLNSISAAVLARGVSKRSPTEGPSQAELFAVSLFGNAAGTKLALGLSAACTSCAGGTKSTSAPVDLIDFPIRVTVELSIGDGAAGRLKYWIGADDISLPPTRPVLGDLDNGRWEHIERVSVGVSDTTMLWRSIMAGNPLTLDQIAVADTSLFWSDFDSDDADNVATTIPGPLTSNMLNQGDTCSGSNLLPQIAAGSTSFRGPVTVQQMVIPAESGGRIISLSSASGLTMAAFLCRVGGGPASQCLLTGEPGSPLVIPFSLSGVYWVVVGAVGRIKDGACGNYALQVSGPL